MDPSLNRSGNHPQDAYFAEVPGHGQPTQGQTGPQAYAQQTGYPGQQIAYQGYQSYSGSIQSRPTNEQRFAPLPMDSVIMSPPSPVQPAQPVPPPQQYNVATHQGYGSIQSPPQGPATMDSFGRPKSSGMYNPLMANPNIQVQNQLQKQSYPPPAPNNPFQSGAPQMTQQPTTQNESIHDNSRLSNHSRVSVRSPLRMNVMNAVPGLPTDGMRRSSSGRILRETEYPDDINTLKLTYLARNDELKDLNNRIAILEGKSQVESSPGHLQSEQEISRLEKELNDLTTHNSLLKRELEQVKSQVLSASNDMDLKLAQMRAKLQENARKNMEMYERELMFKYRNNDDETIKFLREKIAHYEKGR